MALEDIKPLLVPKKQPVKEESGNPVLGFLGDTGVSAAKSVVGLGEAAVGLADIPTLGGAGKFAKDTLGVDFERTNAILDNLKSDRQKAADARVAEAQGFGDTVFASLENPSTIFQSIVESGAPIGGARAIAQGIGKFAPKLAGVAAGAIGEGSIGGGSITEGIRQQTKSGTLTGKQVALGAASAVGTSFFGVAGGKLAKKLGVADIDVIGSTGNIVKQASSKKFASAALKAGISEGVFEEMPQSIQETMFQNAALDKPLLEGVPESAALGLLTGSVMGGAVGAISRPRPALAVGAISRPRPALGKAKDTLGEEAQKEVQAQQPNNDKSKDAPIPDSASKDSFATKQQSAEDLTSRFGVPESSVESVQNSELQKNPALEGELLQPVKQPDQKIDGELNVDPVATQEKTFKEKVAFFKKLSKEQQKSLVTQRVGELKELMSVFTSADSRIRASLEKDVNALQSATNNNRKAIAALPLLDKITGDTKTARIFKKELTTEQHDNLVSSLQNQGKFNDKLRTESKDNKPSKTSPDDISFNKSENTTNDIVSNNINSINVTSFGESKKNEGGNERGLDVNRGSKNNENNGNLNEQQKETKAKKENQTEKTTKKKTAGRVKLPHLTQKESNEINSIENLSEDFLSGRFGRDRLNDSQRKEIVKSQVFTPKEKIVKKVETSNVERVKPKPNLFVDKAKGVKIGDIHSDGNKITAIRDTPNGIFVSTTDAKVDNNQKKFFKLKKDIAAKAPAAKAPAAKAPAAKAPAAKVPAAKVNNDNISITKNKGVTNIEVTLPSSDFGVVSGLSLSKNQFKFVKNKDGTTDVLQNFDNKLKKPINILSLKNDKDVSNFIENKEFLNHLSSTTKSLKKKLNKNNIERIERLIDENKKLSSEISKAPTVTTQSNKELKKDIVSQIDKALLDVASGKKGDKRVVLKSGTSTFRITNSKNSLEAFKKKVQPNPGFKDSRPKKQPNIRAKPQPSLEKTVSDFVKDGELEKLKDSGKANDISEKKDQDSTKERRVDNARRKKIDEMSAKEQADTIATLRGELDKTEKLAKQAFKSELVDLPNKRAWESTKKKKHIAAIDVDSLKWVNDNMGHPTGDRLLQVVGEALRDSGAESFHISGDEFMAHGDDLNVLKKQLSDAAEKAISIGVEATLPDGTVLKHTTVGFSYGTAETATEADFNLGEDKARRQKAGTRVKRGSEPRGLVKDSPKGNKVQNDDRKVKDDVFDAGLKFTQGLNKSRLKSILPDYAKKMQKAGRLQVVQSESEIPGLRDIPNIKGLYRRTEDKIYLIADNLTEKSLLSTLNHELYHRASLTDSVLQKRRTAVKTTMSKMFNDAKRGIGKPDVLTAYDKAIRSASDQKFIIEEFQAYLVSDFNEGKSSTESAGWVKSLLNMIRATLIRAGIIGKNITKQDLNSIAIKYGTGIDPRKTQASDVYFDKKKNIPPSGTNDLFSQGFFGTKKQPSGFEGLDTSTLGSASNIGRGETSKIKNFKDKISQHRILWKRKLRQGFVDQYDSFINVLNDKQAWMMSRLASNSGGAVESIIESGHVFLDKSGAIDIDTSKKGLAEILEPLGVEVDRFMAWIAGNRAERLAAEDRENLFDELDIENLKALSKNDNGTQWDQREETYNKVLKEFEAMNNSVVQIGVDSGLVSKEDAKLWKDQGFYVPFYRIADDTGTKHGVQSISGLVKQNAYKKLKGADMQIDDLLTNTLLNWNHIIGASLKNQAAAKALKTATQGKSTLATKISESEKSNNSVFVKEDGKEVWYELDDTTEGELVLDSLTAMNFNGLNTPSMKAMRAFKRYLTLGVTASPEFKVANLFRDSLQALATTNIDTNLAKNLIQGYKGTAKGSKNAARAKAGGGLFGDSGYVHGADPESIRRLIDKGIDRSSILSNQTLIGKMWDKYQDFGSRLENINRLANFEQDLANGKTLLEANFNARDHLDFQSTGSFVGVRALTQVIPFLNARLQGLDKLGRAGMDPDQQKQMAMVTGIYSAASVLLYMAMKDDEDYINAEEWEKDTYHLFKVPGVDAMFRFPKPFELGVVGTMSERFVEQIVDDKVHGDLFVERLTHALTETLSIGVVPQAFKPAIELWANKNSFTGRAIESQSMKNLSPTNRKKSWTSQTAIALSNVTDSIPWVDVTLSPIQIDHLIRGYLGWVGGTAVNAVDLLARPLTNQSELPNKRLEDFPLLGRFVRESKGRNSKFITNFYERQAEISQDYADLKLFRVEKNFEKAQKLMDEKRDSFRNRKLFNRIARKISVLNRKIKAVNLNKNLTGTQKRLRIDNLNAERLRLARSVIDR